MLFCKEVKFSNNDGKCQTDVGARLKGPPLANLRQFKHQNNGSNNIFMGKNRIFESILINKIKRGRREHSPL